MAKPADIVVTPMERKIFCPAKRQFLAEVLRLYCRNLKEENRCIIVYQSNTLPRKGLELKHMLGIYIYIYIYVLCRKELPKDG